MWPHWILLSNLFVTPSKWQITYRWKIFLDIILIRWDVQSKSQSYLDWENSSRKSRTKNSGLILRISNVNPTKCSSVIALHQERSLFVEEDEEFMNALSTTLSHTPMSQQCHTALKLVRVILTLHRPSLSRKSMHCPNQAAPGAAMGVMTVMTSRLFLVFHRVKN